MIDTDYTNPTEGATHRTYEVYVYDEDLKREFTQDEKDILRPIAEVLAVLDGNAFFGMELPDGKDWYEQYLPEAWAIFQNSGGYNGAFMGASWIEDLHPKNPAVREAYDAYRTIKGLAGNDR